MLFAGPGREENNDKPQGQAPTKAAVYSHIIEYIREKGRKTGREVQDMNSYIRR
jgi:hypothetical protein